MRSASRTIGERRVMGFSTDEFPFTSEYDSDLREVLRYIREVVAYMHTWDETVAELREATKDINQHGTDIAKLKALTNKLDISVTKLKSDVNFILSNLTEINSWQDLTDGKLRILGTRITNLKTYVDDMDNVLMADYNGKFAIYSLKMKQMENGLRSLIAALIERFEYALEHLSSDVYDPIRAERILFDENNKNIYADLRIGGITEEALAYCNFTEEELQEYNLTQYDWAFNSNYFFKQFYIHSPVRGIKMSPYQALSDVLTFICGTMTESVFASLNLTEEEFEALNMTHAEYLRYNATIGGVVVAGDGNGLTENQLQHLTTL